MTFGNESGAFGIRASEFWKMVCCEWSDINEYILHLTELFKKEKPLRLLVTRMQNLKIILQSFDWF